ncbi:hypothetical protein ABZV92_06060 [Streptomyces rubiginosohelvolus]|uniref:hypothetical protein n=1 Tax=Streptomyces rubiginosohelvolus TaxID=67362 RepID=UPI0033B062FA
MTKTAEEIRRSAAELHHGYWVGLRYFYADQCPDCGTRHAYATEWECEDCGIGLACDHCGTCQAVSSCDPRKLSRADWAETDEQTE